MLTQEAMSVERQLREQGTALTSFDALGIEQYDALAIDLVAAVESTDQYHDAQTGSRHGMLMFREEAPLTMGRRLILPVAEALFADNPDVMTALGMYAINHYEEGDFFNPHQDHFDGTVMIMTPMGRRQFDVYKKEAEDDVFLELDRSYILEPGSIILLNGYKNLGHAAKCLTGPSISVVADVPFAMSAQ